MIARQHALLYVLSAIVILNVLIIFILQQRVVESESANSASGLSPELLPTNHPSSAPIIVSAPKPAVRAIILWQENVCDDCFDVGKYLEALNGTMNLTVEHGEAGVFEQYVLRSSDLDSRVTRFPAIAFNDSIEFYPQMTKDWEGSGYIVTFSDDGAHQYPGTWYVLPTLNAPYYLPGSHAVMGRVKVTYLVNRACQSCAGVEVFENALSLASIVPTKEMVVDVSSAEGKSLIDKYGITSVPTILLSPDAKEYSGFVVSWSVVGSVEPDGTYILRDLQRMKITYYDLQSNKVMIP